MADYTAMTVLDEIKTVATTREIEFVIDGLAIRADIFEKIKSWWFEDGSRIWRGIPRRDGRRAFNCCPPRSC